MAIDGVKIIDSDQRYDIYNEGDCVLECGDHVVQYYQGYL